jgi:cytochrome oxidase Cu insertion factor (SCO1/SenC/PrrC family)
MLLVNPSVESYRVDEDGKPIQSSEYNNTEAELENYLNELRRNRTRGIE